MLVMVQREVGERLAAAPGDAGLRHPVGEGRPTGPRRGRRAGAARGVPAPAEGRVGPRAHRRAGPRRPPTPTRRAVRAGAPRLRPAPQDAAPLAGWPGRPRAFATAGVGPRPAPRSSPSRTGAPGRRARLRTVPPAKVTCRAGQADPVAAGTGGRGRRLSPARRRDGHPRPRRHPRDDRRPRGIVGPTARGARRGRNLVRRALAPSAAGRRGARQADPVGRRSGRRVRRCRSRAAVGGSSRPRCGGRSWAPMSRSVSSAAGPGSPASASGSSRCPVDPDTRS